MNNGLGNLAATGSAPNPDRRKDQTRTPAFQTLYELLIMTIRSATGLPQQSARLRGTHDLRQKRTFAPKVAMYKYTEQAAIQ
jgi:hypothetical protein